MFNLIIAEDEVILLDRLSKIVDYNEYGFNLVQLFTNGEDAINYIRTNNVDLIISDIKMPKATGLDIAKYIHTNKLNTKVVILSGYSEFEYARESIHNNVFDFISKPFRKTEYIEMLKKAYDAIHMSKQNTKFSPYENDAFFRRICYGSYTDEKEIKDEIKKLNLNIDIIKNPCMYFTLDIENPEEYLNKPTHIMSNLTNIASNILLLEDIPIKYCSVINFTLAHIEYFLIFDAITSSNSLMKNITRQITQFMKQLGLDVTIKNSILFNNIAEVVSQKVISLKELLKVYIQSFADCLSSGEWEKINSSCDTVFSTIKKLDVEDYTESLNALIDKINPILKMSSNKSIAISEINKIQDSNQKFDYVKKLVTDATTDCFNRPPLINSITAYINSNYSKPITLDDVAKNSYISKVYLCQYIKKHTKMTFNEYITHVRIEKSKELLKNTSLKIYQISEMVGYKTTAHFIKIFKSATGITPSDYKKQH